MRSLLVAVLLPAVFAGPALAQFTPAGIVVVENNTGVPVTVVGEWYNDTLGTRVDLKEVFWDLKPGASARLLTGDNNSITARHFSFKVKTTEGSTGWNSTCKTTDQFGQFKIGISEENLRSHYKTLGVAAPPAANPFAGPGPNDDQVKAAIVKIGAGVVAHLIAVRANNEETTLFTAIAVGIAKKARDEAIKSALHDLFPAMTDQQARALQIIGSGVLDGEVNLDRERLVQRMRQAGGDARSAAEVADLILRVRSAYNR